MASDAEQGQLQAAPESFLSKDLVENISRWRPNPGPLSLVAAARFYGRRRIDGGTTGAVDLAR